MANPAANPGGSKPWQNRAGLDERVLGFLVQDLSALEKVSPDLPAKALCYVLDGEEAGVLSELAQTEETAKALGLIGTLCGVRSSGPGPRSGFFSFVQCAQPQFFIRLGKLYAAALEFQMSTRSQVRAQVPIFAGFLPPATFGDAKLTWLEMLLVEATELKLNAWPRSCRACPALSADLIEAMLQAEEQAPELLVRAAFQPPLARFGSPPLEAVFKGLAGLAQSAVRHKQVMLEILSHVDLEQRIYALDLMGACKVPVVPFAEQLVELVFGSSKQVREHAEPLLAQARPVARPLLERKLVAGESDERVTAARLLWEWEGEGVRSLFEERVREDKSKKVKAVLAELLAKPEASQSAEPDELRLPALPVYPAEAPLGPDTERAWRECFECINFTIAQGPGGGNRLSGNWKPIAADTVAEAFVALQRGPEGGKAWLQELFAASYQTVLSAPFKGFWERPELQPIHFVRFLMQVGALKSDREQHAKIVTHGFWLESLLPVYRRAHPEVGLRELGAAFTAAGLDAKRIAQGLLASFQEIPLPFGLPPAHIWPYWAEHVELLEEAFAPKSRDFLVRFEQRRQRRNAFYALRTFPRPPSRLLPLLWDLALGPKAERPQAQQCLAGAADKVERLTTALSGGTPESRLAAAEWLGRLGDQGATAALLAALKREKTESTKSALMGGLEQLGVPVEQFLDRGALLKEAEKGLTKGVPEELQWFPFEQLPAVHWLDNGKPVEPAILKWWLVQGFKLKNPEPGALLRKYCASLKPLERQALGQFVLEAWVAKDTSPRVGVEAEKEAMRRAQAAVLASQQWAQWAQQNPQIAQQMAAYAPKQKSLQEYYEELLLVVQREPTGTAIASKGILSLAGACAGAGAAPVVRQYLKDWYGMRVAQCRALLQMLVWVEHKTATQLLLAVGTRFRTKSIQEEASKQAQALADRKGWTVAELADRTIPTAGLDDQGALTLDFGPRQFTARLNADLAFTLADAEGKPLKSLPDPRKDDNEAKAAEAKKLFSAARKELKSVLTMQRDRLYEAMCTQRTWPFEDWNLYLNRHPIVGHHCQRLVWAVVREEKVAALFRPLPDGSLTDAKDDPVMPGPEDLIRVAHECQVTPEQSQLWRQHLKDYEVEPLFEQFGRPNFALTEEHKQEDELGEFRGHVLEAFRLRGRATKLDYTRGQAQDGGWFCDYHKRFPTLGIEAILEFTGNSLPEQNRTVALTTLHFERVAAEGDPVNAGAKMALGEVPPVLLSECWNDLRQMAAEGSGFDPEWESKIQV
jgi:hypothetical protein